MRSWALRSEVAAQCVNRVRAPVQTDARVGGRGLSGRSSVTAYQGFAGVAETSTAPDTELSICLLI
jgi:hypothetical protein